MRIPALAALLLALLQGGTICLSPTFARAALADLDDDAMEQVAGAGIAIALDDFEFAMAPTSYFEQVGSDPTPKVCSGTGSAASNTNCWRRGDLRWYGINISAAGGSNDGYQWNDSTPCSSSTLNCPRGGTIPSFSPFDNPYLIRSQSPQGMAYDGTCVNGSAGGCAASAMTKAIYEFLAPSSQPNYTFSWWGEIEVGSTRNSATQTLATNAGNTGANLTNGGGLLKSQNIIRGNAAGSVFRLFRFTQTGNLTFGMSYHSRLQGDYRLSVAQQAGGSGVIGVPTLFADDEGMYFRNVNAYLPLGQLYYQALTVSPEGTSGSFNIELTPLPNTAPVYNLHYAINSTDILTGCTNVATNPCTYGYATARANNTGGTTTAQYQLTHGFSRWGGWSATGTYTTNAINDSTDGINFRGCSGCGSFYAYADTNVTIDARGPGNSRNQVQNYDCATGNAGSCTTASPPGPITTGSVGDLTRTYPTTAVNLGDARLEGLMFNSLKFTSCTGGVTC